MKYATKDHSAMKKKKVLPVNYFEEIEREEQTILYNTKVLQNKYS